MKETWKNIPNFDNKYRISNDGVVFSNVSGVVLNQYKDKDGYMIVHLSKHHQTYNRRVHRLVAQAFIPNPNDLPMVNHKDCDRSNNNVDNLELCDAKYNAQYGYLYGGLKNCITHIPRDINNKRIQQFTKDGLFVKEYPSVKIAAKETGISRTNIQGCANPKYKNHKSAGGFIWKYS